MRTCMSGHVGAAKKHAGLAPASPILCKTSSSAKPNCFAQSAQGEQRHPAPDQELAWAEEVLRALDGLRAGARGFHFDRCVRKRDGRRGSAAARQVRAAAAMRARI